MSISRVAHVFRLVYATTHGTTHGPHATCLKSGSRTPHRRNCSLSAEQVLGTSLAVKIVPLDPSLSEGQVQSELKSEIALMREFDHRNIVGFFDAFPMPQSGEVTRHTHAQMPHHQARWHSSHTYSWLSARQQGR